ncbi:hypothetical protein F4780DRAFT_64253 [Xylariomycetidae sp. FL0641]|nr:hypothetical protein F4780DRAFT_64253 [Xylariomycetidae sp. FL0641]
MCTDVWTLFTDPSCNHTQYQNTFECHIVRRCSATDDMLLSETKFLPDQRGRVPLGMMDCKLRKATRPQSGKCRECVKKEWQAKQGMSVIKETSESTADESFSSMQNLINPSPDGAAVARMRNSLIEVTQKQQGTPQNSLKSRTPPSMPMKGNQRRGSSSSGS